MAGTKPLFFCKVLPKSAVCTGTYKFACADKTPANDSHCYSPKLVFPVIGVLMVAAAYCEDQGDDFRM